MLACPTNRATTTKVLEFALQLLHRPESLDALSSLFNFAVAPEPSRQEPVYFDIPLCPRERWRRYRDHALAAE
eukprot:5457993-Amphidinium_carterae.1